MRRYSDGTVVCVERQFDGKRLHFKTMWKKALVGIPITIMVGSHFNQDEEEGM